MPNFTPEELEEFERCRKEIQGLTDHYQGKKATQSDNRIIAATIRSQDPKWKENISQSQKIRFKNNPNLREHQSKVQKQKHQDPAYKKKHQEAHRTDQYRQQLTANNIEAWQNDVVRKRRLDGINKAWQDPEIHAKKAALNKSLAQTEEWKETHQKTTVRATIKPMQTPKGIYKSLKDAAAAFEVAVPTMQYWMAKSKKEQFFYLTSEEAEEWKRNNL